MVAAAKVSDEVMIEGSGMIAARWSRNNNGQKSTDLVLPMTVNLDKASLHDSVSSLVKLRVWISWILRLFSALWFCQSTFEEYSLHFVTWIKNFPRHQTHFRYKASSIPWNTWIPPTPSKFLCYFPKILCSQGPALKEGKEEGSSTRACHVLPCTLTIFFTSKLLKSWYGLSDGEREVPHRPVAHSTFPVKSLTSEIILST